MKIRGQYLTMQNDISFVQRHPEYYVDPPSQAILSQWQREISSNVDDLDEIIRGCAQLHEGICRSPSFVLPDSFALPERRQSLVPKEESIALGTVWYVDEAGWKGTWTRRANSREFDASWLHTQSGEILTGDLEIHIHGRAVTVIRKNSTDHPTEQCSYQGILDDQGNVDGHYSCSWSHGGEMRWSARISHRPVIEEHSGPRP